MMTHIHTYHSFFCPLRLNISVGRQHRSRLNTLQRSLQKAALTLSLSQRPRQYRGHPLTLSLARFNATGAGILDGLLESHIHRLASWDTAPDGMCTEAAQVICRHARLWVSQLALKHALPQNLATLQRAQRKVFLEATAVHLFNPTCHLDRANTATMLASLKSQHKLSINK